MAVRTLPLLIAGCFLLSLVPTLASQVGWVPTGVASGLSVAALLGLICVLVLAVSRPGLGWFGPAVRRGAADDGRLSLTFDDGPHPDSTPALLDALRAAKARATFFVLVDRAERWPGLTRAIAAEHEIALHGLAHHPWLTLWSPRRGAAELEEARVRLEALVGGPVRMFRPPFGVTSPRLAEATALAGLETIWCSVRVGDGVRISNARILARCRSARAGDIVLLHEGPRPAARLLGQILAELRARGLHSVSVGELREVR